MLEPELFGRADAEAETIMPGFTRLHGAQPVTFGHHLMAYFEMFGRDADRLADCRKRVSRLPLGASALAGTSFPIDREAVARALGFDGVCENSPGAASARHLAVESPPPPARALAPVCRRAQQRVVASWPIVRTPVKPTPAP